MLLSPDALARQLLGRNPDRVSPIFTYDHRATHRCDVGGQSYLCKADVNAAELAKEVIGHRYASASGLPVPELIAVARNGVAMRWVDGRPLTQVPSNAAWRATGGVLRRVHEQEPIGPLGGGFAPERGTWFEAIAAQVDDAATKCARTHGLDPAQASRVRAAVVEARAAFDDAPMSWVHGDLQPEHVLLAPSDDAEVAAIVDWSDHGRGDVAWDVAVLTLEHEARVDLLLDSYGPTRHERARIVAMLPFYRLVRWLSEVCWLREHDLSAGHALAELHAWRPPS